MPENADDISQVRQALGWAPQDGPEEQAAHARLGGQEIPDAPPSVIPSSVAPVVAPVVPVPPAPTPQPYQPITPEVDNGLKLKSNQEAAAYKQQLVQAGWEDQAAHYAATQYARAQYNDYKNQHLLQGQEDMAKSQVAQRLGQQYGVDAGTLLNYTTPAQMEAAAKAQQSTDKRIAALEANKAAPKAPVQAFDSGQGQTGGMTTQQKKIAFATGKIKLTNKEYREVYGR